MSQHHQRGQNRRIGENAAPGAQSNPTYAALASLRDRLRSSKVTERRAASKELLEKLQDSSAVRRLEREAERGFENAMLRSRGGGGGRGGDPQATLPWDRVCVLYRSLMDAALLASRTVVEGGGASGDSTAPRSRKRNHANHTGFTKRSCKFNADDVLFPYKLFMKMDMDQSLEVNDGGYTGTVAWDRDWKTRPRHCHHLDVTTWSSSAANANHGRFNATHYTPHTFTDRDRGSRLSPKEIVACVEYVIHCLNDDDCRDLGTESTLLQWLVHVCSRPAYLAALQMQYQISYILHEVSTRLNRAFVGGSVEERGILPSHPRSRSGGVGGGRNAVPQESLLACAKCLSALVYNCTTQLGMGMHLYIRPAIELVAHWAEDAWRMQSEGEFASSVHHQRRESQVRNPHSKMVEDGQINPSAIRRLLRTESDVLSLLPYLYSSVTHLLAAHPEHSVPILSDHGHALMRMARRNYARPATNLQTRDALTEYVSAHLLIAETSGRLCGLPEGDLGPLVPREGESDKREEEEGRKKRKKKGATLDAKSIAKLLEMVRNRKVWEDLFNSSAASHDAKKKKARKTLIGRKRGRSGCGSFLSAEGGASWTPLNRRQRRHLELAARLTRIAQRLHLADAEDQGNGTSDSLETLIDLAEERMQRSGIEQGEIDILPKAHGYTKQQPALAASGSEVDERHMAMPNALACSPWICMIGHHLYELNPNLGKLTASFASGDESLHGKDKDDDMTSYDRILLESCPMLRALTVDKSELLSDPASLTAVTDASMTQGTMDTSLLSLTGQTPAKSSRSSLLDPVRPTLAATLQLLVACVEFFPRGECWSSSTRSNWGALLDERVYPAGTAARVLERGGSSPADAAAVVYLLGTALESYGGSRGEEEEDINDMRLWTLLGLLKMTESSSVICSREGLLNGVESFASPSSLRALRVSWRRVWKILFRYDLRYSAFTATAYANNVGELVIQLLTQIVRWRCIDLDCLLSCPPPSHLGGSGSIGRLSTVESSSRSPFAHRKQGWLWELPVFEDASSSFSGAPFELIMNVVQHAGFAGVGEVGSATLPAAANASLVSNSANRDRKYFVSFCSRFFELCLEETAESTIRRTFLPYAAICLTSLIRGGNSSSFIGMSTFELDGLARFGVTEDSDVPCTHYHFDVTEMKNGYFDAALWADCIMPSQYLSNVDGSSALRLTQGRGALLNRHLGADYERNQLLWYMMNQYNSSHQAETSPPQSSLANAMYEKIKSHLEELMFEIKYDNGNEEDSAVSLGAAASERSSGKSLALPQLTSCLSLTLTILLSKHSSTEEISQSITQVYPEYIAPALDLLVEKHGNLFKDCPSDFLVVFNHLQGIARVLTLVAAFGGGGAAIPRLFSHQGESLQSMCKQLLKEYRNATCTSGPSNVAASSKHASDSDDSDANRFTSRGGQTRQSQTQRPKQAAFNYSDDSEGLMDDGDQGGRDRLRKQRDPLPKRRRIGNGRPHPSRARHDFSQGDDRIDYRSAWACASFMITLRPSFQCLELISSHLVWPEDSSHQAGYGSVSRTPDPFSALVCAAIFCQKSVLLRRDRLDLRNERGRQDDEGEDQASALILSIEVILQARRYQPPSSRYFMCGMGLVSDAVYIGDYSESCSSIGVDESKVILEALYPEGVGKESEDYHLLKQRKRILKYRNCYRARQLRAATLVFLYAQSNLRKEFEGGWFWNDLILPSFRHMDEDVRARSCDLLAAVLGRFSEQKQVVSDVLSRALPRIDKKKAFQKWVSALQDMKLQEELTLLEEEALADAEDSIENHSIHCMGLIAGSTSDSALSREMIWALIDLAAKKPTIMLPCFRACKRASFLLGFTDLSDMLDGMMPHLLVKWLESQRSLRDFPLLLSSPFALERACHHLPNEILSMLVSGGGWTDDFFSLDDMQGGSHCLNGRLLTSFVGSVAKFLIPNILLSAPDDSPTNTVDANQIVATNYLTDCVLILTGVDSDENVAKVLCNHISDLYGFVAVLAENGDAAEECENAFKLLKRCVSSVHIERTGAKNAFLVARHILLLHCKGISVVGLEKNDLNREAFIQGMKYVAKQLKSPSKHVSFLEQLGSSMIECIVLVKYWLSSSVTSRQRKQSWGTMALLCDIMSENIQQETVATGELGFFLHSFIVILLDPRNNEICPLVMESLQRVLDVLFSNEVKDMLVDETDAVLQKLILALLQIHQRAFKRLHDACCVEYEQKSSRSVLLFDDGQSSLNNVGPASWESSPESNDVLKCLIRSKAELEEKVSSDTMVGAYESIVHLTTGSSQRMQLDNILGAEDIVLQGNQKEEVFRSVNEKFSLLSLFNLIDPGSEKGNEVDIGMECDRFVQIMEGHPICDDIGSSNSYSSHAVLARLLALRRLERALLSQHKTTQSDWMPCQHIYPFLLSIIHSGDPDESRVISSRCLGEIKFIPLPESEIQTSLSTDEEVISLNDPISSIKRTILTMLGQFLLSECAGTSLVAMKTSKALLVTPSGKECLRSLHGDMKGLLSPFNAVDDGKLRKEAVRVSKSCIERLKSTSSSPENDDWCWNDQLWTCPDSEDYDIWIRKITSSIIICCFNKGSKVGTGDQDFFQICQGLCAMEADFASSIFPALIFHLLDSEAKYQCKENSCVRDIVMSNIAIGSLSSMNTIISNCFSRILSSNPNDLVAPKAITVVLDTLELLRGITEHRFLTSTEHVKNKSTVVRKQNSSLSKKRRSRNPSDDDNSSFASSPKWRGFPYGVVLKVSGLDVARSCFRVKRYYSALYYAEMSLQNLIGSGTFFEDIANDSTAKSLLRHGEAAVNDISGFGVLLQKEETQGGETALEQALLARDIIGCCLSELQAKDELEGTESTGYALNLKQNITSLAAIEACRRDIIANALDKDQRADLDRSYLREKWFEDSLNEASRWNDFLLPRAQTEGERLRVACDMKRSHIAQPMSFYESVHEALCRFGQNNYSGGLEHVMQARKSVLADMERLAGSEAQSTGMLTHLYKFNILGQLELVAKTLEGKSTVKFLLDRWGYGDDTGAETLESLLLKEEVNFDIQDKPVEIDGSLFSLIRTECSVREIALKVLFGLGQGLTGKALATHIYKSCNLFRDLCHPDAAMVSLSSLRGPLKGFFQKFGFVDGSSSKLALLLRLEDAKIMVKQKNLDGAIMHCNMIANYLTNATNSADIERDQICAESMLLGGLYMAQHNVDAAESILSSFEKASELAMRIHRKSPSDSSIQLASAACFKLGEFSSLLTNSVESRVMSEAWKRRKVAAKDRKKELQVVTDQITKMHKKSRECNENAALDLRIIHATLSREVEMDERELKSVEQSNRHYLHLALQSYCNALKLCPTATVSNVSKHVFNLVSLWFKNCQQKETNKLINSNLTEIPSFRLVPLVYQLFSRIDEVQGDNDFQSALRNLTIKICSEHPYHSLVQLLALSNGKRVGEGVNGRHADAYLENVGTAKVDAVNNIIKELRKAAPEYVSQLIDRYQILMTGYMNLAEHDTSSVQKRQIKGISFKQYKLDLDCCLTGGRRGKRISASAVGMPSIITKPPQIRPDAQYGNGIDDPVGTERVVSFDPTFDLTLTGLHRPKIVRCIGSKGGIFKQLVKGEDDLRQDAIMQQVFATVNGLLRLEGSSGCEFIKNSSVTRRHLRLITYGITPLSPASGVLEWVDNTMCFGDFLTDRGKQIGAHSKYYPGEWGNNDVREFYKRAGEARNATPESKRNAFDTICKNFSPAFRFFFLEYFNSSMEAWHTARTLYTRSCAVNSVVGHILGIGDRHTSNILVHTKTGEVVHIDFGIVFEQGKTLTTPELVPFRLTRDLVDGMGPTGTDGVFSKAAEATMGVLRNNADTLLTILSAVVSDPLYKWNLSPQKAKQHQRNNGEGGSRMALPRASMTSASDDNRNDAADRAIAKIHEKLEGYEDGTSGEHKTVAGQVKLLINEARDPGNLCMMFAGWAPWM